VSCFLAIRLIFRIRAAPAVAVAAALLATSCGDGGGGGGIAGPDTRVASVIVGGAPATLEVGASAQLSATARSADGAPIGGKTFAWTTSDASLASVGSTGNLSVLGAGSVAITARESTSGVAGTLTLTLVPAAVQSVIVTPDSASVIAGGTQQLSAELKDARGAVLAGRPITWSSSDTLVARVDATGLITGVRPGAPVTISATAEGKAGITRISVVPVPVASVTLSPDTLALQVGATGLLAATVRDASGAVLSGRLVVWTSSDTTVASVAEVGLVTARAAGAATITAATEGRSASVHVTVAPVQVASVEISPVGPLTVEVGASVTLSAVARGGSGAVLPGRTVIWTSADTATATIDAAGVLVGRRAGGPVAVTGTVEGVGGSVMVTVAAVTVASVSVAPDTATLEVGSSRQLTAAVRDVAGGALAGRPVTWTSSDTTVATVTDAGLAVAHAAGSATITASSGGMVGTAAITVVATTRTAHSLEIASGAVVLPPRTGRLQLRAVMRDQFGNAMPDAALHWSSADTAVAAVDAAGMVSAGTIGRANVTVRSGTLAASLEVSVAVPPNPGANGTSSHRFRASDLHVARGALTAARGNLWLFALAYHDFTGDGRTDVFIAPLENNGPPQAPQLMVNDGQGGFVPGPLIGAASLWYGRKVLVADYNADGHADVLLVGTGPSQPPYPGEAPVLLLGDGRGGFVPGASLAQASASHFTAAVADVTGDGHPDIFLPAPNGARLLVNDGRGGFRADDRMVPPHLGGLTLAAELLDVDGDGFIDIVAGGHEFEGAPTQILWGAADGWSLQRRTVLPVMLGFGIVQDINLADLDGDGRPDVVLGRTTDTPVYQGYAVQVLRQIAPRQFVGSWSTSLRDAQPIDMLRLQDHDGDGSLDILVDDAWRGMAWLNDGAASFSSAPPLVAGVSVAPATLNLTTGETHQLTARLWDIRGNELTGRNITWESSDASMARVGPQGLVTGVGAGGPVRIAATAEGRSGAAEVRVTAPAQTPVRLEIVPGSLLLPGIGVRQTLRAVAYDVMGREIPAGDVRWRSLRPQVVSVSATGEAVAAAFGSAQVIAESGAISSAPVLVLVAQTAAGAVLVSDAQVVGDPIPLSAGAQFGVGARYQIRLSGVTPPQVGSMLVGTGEAPVAGRVVAASQSGGTTTVTLEVVPITELLPGLVIDERIPLTADSGTQAVSMQSGTAGPLVLSGAAPATSAADEVRIGPFTCKAANESGLQIAIVDISVLFDVRPDWVLKFDSRRLDAQMFVELAGTVRGRWTVSAKPVAKYKVQCRSTRPVWEFPIPAGGVISYVFGGQVPIGYGFDLEGSIEAADMHVTMGFDRDFNSRFGIECTSGRCRSVDGLPTGPAKWVWEPGAAWIHDHYRAAVTTPVYAFAQLTVGVRKLREWQVELVTARAGVEVKAELASTSIQAADPEYASAYSLNAFVSAEIEKPDAVQTFEDLVGGISIEMPKVQVSVPLATSPTGSLSINPATALAQVDGVRGDTVTMTVSLANPNFLGVYSVKEIQIGWLKTSPATGRLTVYNGPPGCTTITPTHQGQATFTCTTVFREADAGEQTFVAFVKTNLGGLTFPVPLEVRADSRATVTVERSPVKLSVGARLHHVTPGDTLQFFATVSGTDDRRVTWTAEGGTITEDGLFTAGPELGRYRVHARSLADTAQSGERAVFVARKIGDFGVAGQGWAGAVNRYNQVVGFARRPNQFQDEYAFEWDRGTLRDLGAGFWHSRARAINDMGQIVGEGMIDRGDRAAGPIAVGHGVTAVRWEDGHMELLLPFAGSFDLWMPNGSLEQGLTSESRAYGNNNRGHVVGSFGMSGGLRRAFLWKPGSVTFLGTLGGASEALDINDAGQIVGQSARSNGQWHAFLWENGVMRDLGITEGERSFARAINERGQIIGSYFRQDQEFAFLWENGTMRTLTPTGGYVFGINDAGAVVGVRLVAPGPFPVMEGFLWRDGVYEPIPWMSPSGITRDGRVVGVHNGDLYIW
jgi:probable HAF family extracellular repeat protein